MGEFLDRPARLSLSLREREGNVGITPDNYQILPPSSNHIYSNADLSNADLQDSNLRDAILQGANLSDAVLHGAILSGADLSGAIVTQAQLNEAKSLQGTIMPDGSKHP